MLSLCFGVAGGMFCCRGAGDWGNLGCDRGDVELVAKAVAEVVFVLVVG